MFKKNSPKEFNLNFWLITGLAAIILLALLVGLIISSQTNIILNKKIAEIKEAERPAEIDIVILKESSCQDCFDVKPVIDVIRGKNVKVNSERTLEITSTDGMELINKFNIDKAPTFIITGEIEKDANLKAIWPKIGEVRDNTFILKQVGAPYVLTSSGGVKGRVKLIMLMDRQCSECYDVTQHEIILKQFGMPTQDQEILDIGFNDGKELVDKYKIKLLPTIVLTGDIDVYPSLKEIWPQVGTTEEDGAYVFREGVKQMGIYKDLITNTVIKPETSQSNP